MAEPAIDLREVGSDPWSGLAVPRGWAPVGRACRRLARRLDTFTEHVVEQVFSEVSDYGGAPVSREDLFASIKRNAEMALVALAERRDPHPEELRVRRELGHRRAAQGFPIESILQAYHVGFRELWLALVEEATREGGRALALVYQAVPIVWNWVYQTTGAVADAHRETTRTQDALATGARQRFVELLLFGDLDADELVELAHSLAFDPEAEFVAACVRGEAGGVEGAGEPGTLDRALDNALAQRASAHLVAFRRSERVVLTQGLAPEEVAHVLGVAAPRAAAGLGAARAGLAGARLSVGDAERALDLATARGGVCRFGDEAVAATLFQARDRLRPLLEPGIVAAERNPYLGDAVRAFDASGFSATRAARRLMVSPNTVAYRLRRWQELTGWDPLAHEGLSRSLLAIEIAHERISR